MDEIHYTGPLIAVGLFFIGLLFTWLRSDLRRIESKLDKHLISHTIE